MKQLAWKKVTRRETFSTFFEQISKDSWRIRGSGVSAEPKASSRTARVIAELEALGVTVVVSFIASPMSADQYNIEVDFADGYLDGQTGNYIGGQKGVYVNGRHAVLLLAYKLGLGLTPAVLARQCLEDITPGQADEAFHRFEALRRAYQGSQYEVQLPGGKWVVLRHGQPNSEFDDYLEQNHPRAWSWVFVTAWNPKSVQVSEPENLAAMDRLRAELKKLGVPYLDGVGRGASGWEEPSLLAIGPALWDAMRLGARFGQNAVLVGRKHEDAAVVWCRRAV